MKKFSEFKNKLTVKQAKTYSVIISLIITLCVMVLSFTALCPFNEVAGIIIAILVPIGGFFVSMFLCHEYIFRIDEKTFNEDFDKAKPRVILSYNLTVESYAQVKYNFSKAIKNDSERDMLEKLLAHSAYNFYVKLNDKDEIELIVKDKDQNIVYTDTFTNFIYLENYFEKID